MQRVMETCFDALLDAIALLDADEADAEAREVAGEVSEAREEAVTAARACVHSLRLVNRTCRMAVCSHAKRLVLLAVGCSGEYPHSAPVPKHCTHVTEIVSVVKYDTHTTRIEPLSGLKNLRTLRISGDTDGPLPLSSPGLSGLTRLDIPRIDDADVSTWPVLAGLKRLEISSNSLRLGAAAPLHLLLGGLEELHINDDDDHVALDELQTGDEHDDHVPPAPAYIHGSLHLLTRLTRLHLNMHLEEQRSIDPVSALVGLRHLAMQGHVQSLAPLSTLTRLARLELKTMFDWEDPLTLRHLSTLASLTALHLEYEGFDRRAQTWALEPLANLVQLTELGLRHRCVFNLDALSLLTNLRSLVAPSSEEDTDAGAFSTLVRLSQLEFDCWGLEDIDGLSKLTGLKELRLHGRPASIDLGFAPVAALTNLESLTVGTRGAFDLSTVDKMHRLKILSIPYCGGELLRLSHLTNLRGLRLEDSTCMPIRLVNFDSLAPLSGMTNLEFLFANSSNIVFCDLAPLSALTRLRCLNVALYGRVSLSPLSGLTRMEHLELRTMRRLDFFADRTAAASLCLPDDSPYDLGSISRNMVRLESLAMHPNAWIRSNSADFLERERGAPWLSELTRLRSLDLPTDPDAWPWPLLRPLA